jgi:hypothetical protein
VLHRLPRRPNLTTKEYDGDTQSTLLKLRARHEYSQGTKLLSYIQMPSCDNKTGLRCFAQGALRQQTGDRIGIEHHIPLAGKLLCRTSTLDKVGSSLNQLRRGGKARGRWLKLAFHGLDAAAVPITMLQRIQQGHTCVRNPNESTLISRTMVASSSVVDFESYIWQVCLDYQHCNFSLFTKNCFNNRLVRLETSNQSPIEGRLLKSICTMCSIAYSTGCI